MARHNSMGKLAYVPNSAAAKVAHQSPQRNCNKLCRHCNWYLWTDKDELLCRECFMLFNQGVGVGRECARLEQSE